jgi:DNA polymerase IIIc chi subunit
MIKISYYKTTSDRFSKAFCMLAEKCYHNNIGIFVYTNNEKCTMELDKALWTYSKKQFIPHGTIHDPHPEKQPILLGEEFKNLNNSSSLLIINANEDQILTILHSVGKNQPVMASSPKGDVAIQRLFFLYEENPITTAPNLQNILGTSAIGEFNFESYTQEINGNWRKIGE